MKTKILSLFAIIVLLLAITSCGSPSYEEKFLGKWVCSSGNQTIIYEFKYEDGTYKAGCVTHNYDVYLFDEYTASSKVITFRQGGKQMKYYYSFKDGYLYIDDLEFEKWD